jgi:hypothetical protein
VNEQISPLRFCVLVAAASPGGLPRFTQCAGFSAGDGPVGGVRQKTPTTRGRLQLLNGAAGRNNRLGLSSSSFLPQPGPPRPRQLPSGRGRNGRRVWAAARLRLRRVAAGLPRHMRDDWLRALAARLTSPALHRGTEEAR